MSSSRRRAKTFISMNVALRRTDEVLLIRRQGTGWNDGGYGLVAGHLEEGERPEDAAVREALEETGVRIRPADLTPFHVDYRASAAGPYVDVFFSCERWSGTPRINEPDKADDLLWVPLADLPANMVEYMRAGLAVLARGTPVFRSLFEQSADHDSA